MKTKNDIKEELKKLREKHGYSKKPIPTYEEYKEKKRQRLEKYKQKLKGRE